MAYHKRHATKRGKVRRVSSSILIIDRFQPAPRARSLRSHFEKRFAASSSDRFVWDYWDVPDQYRLLRTPAYTFFPKREYEAFHRQLVLWGRENLGCHDISPPWLSCYVEGCGQELHGDLPHGPWAFVYSLTPWERRKFRGGETLLLRDEILSYWQNLGKSGRGGIGGGRGLEHGEIFRKVDARFNRLTVFDPRIPHGVRKLEGGVHSVLDGRLVIHGWFVQPRPFIEGALRPGVLQSAIDGLSERLGQLLAGGAQATGVLSVRFAVGASGAVSGLRVLTNTLHSAEPGDAGMLARAIQVYLSELRFGRQRGSSRVTLPLVFETG
jgi:hypothetical protein